MVDVAIIETLNGGDAQMNGNDFALVYSFENMLYQAMFGGNPGYDTKKRVEGEQAFDHWANSLLFANAPTQQFNSFTEHTLRTVALTSQGRILIEQAAKKDLKFLQEFGKLTVEVSIVSDDRVKMFIKLTIPDGTTKFTVVNIVKGTDGDFYFADFDKTDFFI